MAFYEFSVVSRPIISLITLLHSRRKSNVFGDAIFLIWAKFIIILSYNQIYPNLTNLAQKVFAGGCGCISCIPSSYDTALLTVCNYIRIMSLSD